MREEAERSRSAWLRQDHPWLSSLYVLWLTLTGALLLTTGFAYRAAGLGTARIHVALAVVALIGAALSLTTMELAYRRQRYCVPTWCGRSPSVRTCWPSGWRR